MSEKRFRVGGETPFTGLWNFGEGGLGLCVSALGNPDSAPGIRRSEVMKKGGNSFRRGSRDSRGEKPEWAA